MLLFHWLRSCITGTPWVYLGSIHLAIHDHPGLPPRSLAPARYKEDHKPTTSPRPALLQPCTLPQHARLQNLLSPTICVSAYTKPSSAAT